MNVVVETMPSDLFDITRLNVKRRDNRRRTEQQIISFKETQGFTDDAQAHRLGIGNLLTRERQPPFDVPHHVGLEQIAVLAQMLDMVSGEQGRAQHLKTLHRTAKVRTRLFDDDTERFEATRRRCANAHHFWIHRHDAQIRAKGDASRQGHVIHTRQHAFLRTRLRQRILAVRAEHRVEHQRGITRGARHRSFDKQQVRGGCVEGQAKQTARNPTRSRPQADHTVERCRRAQAATQIGAMREPDLTGGQRGGGSTGRSGDRLGGVPRIVGAPVHLVKGTGTGAKLWRIRFCDDNRTACFELFNQQVRARRHVLRINTRAIGGAHTRNRVQILDCDRQTGQPAAFAGHAGATLKAARRRHGTINTARRQSIQYRVHRLHAPHRGLHQLQRADFATAQRGDRLFRGQFIQFSCHWRTRDDGGVLELAQTLRPADFIVFHSATVHRLRRYYGDVRRQHRGHAR